ncbi:hypothetical protein E2C01_070213 [Portunus trituberculatus]|uniref:Uncharacterized protein n=1 Tax=Portunus trituberculatus TaxID=210409 RepID=A0A5B7I1I8_PORTR|nr:hypothetical protein [Portunus trituberculatus]
MKTRHGTEGIKCSKTRGYGKLVGLCALCGASSVPQDWRPARCGVDNTVLLLRRTRTVTHEAANE